jgi:hypothetical protein
MFFTEKVINLNSKYVVGGNAINLFMINIFTNSNAFSSVKNTAMIWERRIEENLK